MQIKVTFPFFVAKNVSGVPHLSSERKRFLSSVQSGSQCSSLSSCCRRCEFDMALIPGRYRDTIELPSGRPADGFPMLSHPCSWLSGCSLSHPPFIYLYTSITAPPLSNNYKERSGLREIKDDTDVNTAA